MKKHSNNEPIKTAYYYCFLKDNNSFSLCAITESAHDNAAMMRQLEKRFPIELSESEYRNIQETGGSGFIHEYYERLDAKKQSKQKPQKYIDAALVSSMLPKKRGDRFLYSFDDSSAYITDSYRILKTDKNSFISFLQSKGYYNIENGAEILPREKECIEGSINTHDIFERFSSFTEKRVSEIYTTEKENIPVVYVHIGNDFFSHEHIEKLKKCSIETSCAYYKKSCAGFCRDDSVVYIEIGLHMEKDPGIKPTDIITEPEPVKHAPQAETNPHTADNEKAVQNTDPVENMRDIEQKQETACNSESMRQQETTEGTKTESAVLPHIIAYNNDFTTGEQTTEPQQKQRHIEPKKATHDEKQETDKLPEKHEVKQTEKLYKITEHEPATAPTVALLGHTDSGKSVSVDFKETPHLLIAGATGAGKSIMLHSIICSLLRNNTTDSAQLVLIDPKRVELFDYTDSPMLYGGRIYEDVSDAVEVLEELTEVMNDRYIQLKYSHSRNIDEMHGAGTMPRIYICIDELSFLMTCDKKRLETVISKIGMMGRAAGIHLIVCTQHPDRKTITGTIQANITAVVAMATRTATDSRMIAGSNICAKLRGRGDAVLIDGLREERFQGRYISKTDIHESMEKQKKNDDSNPHRVDPSIMERIKQNILNRMKMN